MKKASLIFLSVAIFFLLSNLLLKPFLELLFGNVFANNNPIISLSIQLIPEALFLAIFIVLNIKVFKQQLLFESYPIGKGIGIMGYSIFLLSIALILGVARVYHTSFLLVVISASLALLVGITEEYIFRGMIFGAIVSKGYSLWIAISVSSVLFGLIHSVNLLHNSFYNVGLQMLYAIPMGAFFAVLYVKSGNLIYPIIAHAVQDFVSFVMSGGKINSTTTTPTGVVMDYVIFGLMIFFYLLFGKKQRDAFKEKLLIKNTNP